MHALIAKVEETGWLSTERDNYNSYELFALEAPETSQLIVYREPTSEVLKLLSLLWIASKSMPEPRGLRFFFFSKF